MLFCHVLNLMLTKNPFSQNVGLDQAQGDDQDLNRYIEALSFSMLCNFS